MTYFFDTDSLPIEKPIQPDNTTNNIIETIIQ